MTSTRNAITLIATVDVSDAVDSDQPSPMDGFLDELRALLAQYNMPLIPCDWAPDSDTILDATPDADSITVVDLNPNVVAR
jgi:hypothetical protein